MSILIRDMAMPKNCGECKLAAIIPIGDYDTYSICPPLHRHIDKYTDTRRTDCPLIELPPHGSLELRITNGDRIRQMTDEELAEVISNLGNCDTCYLYHRGCNMNISCKDAVLDWLRKEANNE